MIGIICKFKLKSGQGPAFEKHMSTMSRTVETNEAGNVFYRAFRTGDPTSYVLLEAYQDKAALEAHGKAEHVLSARPRVAEMRDGDPEIEILQQIW